MIDLTGRNKQKANRAEYKSFLNGHTKLPVKYATLLAERSILAKAITDELDFIIVDHMVKPWNYTTKGSVDLKVLVNHLMSDQKPRTRIQERNRSAILEAALDVFSQFGFRGSTLDMIAENASLSKPNLLYYFNSKETIYIELLETLLDTWLDPLRKLDPDGNPIDEIMSYVRHKMDMSRDFPRESRLFANEILQGAPHIQNDLTGDLRKLVDEKSIVIRKWHQDGKIADIDPYHLIFSVWALTQHYADFDVQVRAVLGNKDPFPGASRHLEQIFTKLLEP